MIAGHLREKNGTFQIVLSFNDALGNRKTKSISTGLPVKGNKKRAEALLMEARQNFDNGVSNDSRNNPKNILFTEFMLEWLEADEGQRRDYYLCQLCYGNQKPHQSLF